jgi:hypothetical protein
VNHQWNLGAASGGVCRCGHIATHAKDNIHATRGNQLLDARNGTITFAPGVAIDADILVYYFDPSQPAPVLPATVPAIVAQNGNLTIVNPTADNTVLKNGYSATGDITISSDTGFQVAGGTK